MKRAPIIIPSISPFKFKKAHALKTSNVNSKLNVVQNEKNEKPTDNQWTNSFILNERLKQKAN